MKQETEMTILTNTPINPADVAIHVISQNDQSAKQSTPALNILPITLVLAMLFIATILGVATNTPVVAFLAGTAAAVTASTFAFLDLYIRSHTNR